MTVTAEDGVATETYTVTINRAIATGDGWGERVPDKDFDGLSDNDIYPYGLWSDGATLWVADWWTGDLLAHDPASQARLPKRDVTRLAGDNPTGMHSDGATMWVADYYGGIYAYRMSDGGRVSAKDFVAAVSAAGNDTPMGLWSDGETLWVTDGADSRVYAYALADKTRQSSREIVLGTGVRGSGLWSDGTTLWMADWPGGRVRAYRLADGEPTTELDIDTGAAGNGAPSGLWSDGETLWVADSDDRKVYAYVMSVADDNASLSDAATLRDLSLSGVDIGTFTTGTTAYVAAVPNAVATTTVTAAATHAAATVAIADGNGSTAGGSRTVTLAEGSNTITVTVTAEDGVATQAYTVTVTRAAPSLSDDATLSGLSLSGINIGTFASGTAAYTADVDNSVETTTVTATAAHAAATVSHRGRKRQHVGWVADGDARRGGEHHHGDGDRRGRGYDPGLHGDGDAGGAVAVGRRDAERV